MKKFVALLGMAAANAAMQAAMLVEEAAKLPAKRWGWIVTSYPWDQIDTRDHASLASNYYKKYKDNDKLVTALRGFQCTTPFGATEFRAIDQQSTMSAYMGPLERRGGLTALHL